mmetsp:Transcript_19681/g.29891  ORF Transcript_19681/g.29891 Transcript_19681/m.29891 type:complete len:1263 (-) Transcript_19681:430-4218(-)
MPKRRQIADDDTVEEEEEMSFVEEEEEEEEEEVQVEKKRLKKSTSKQRVTAPKRRKDDEDDDDDEEDEGEEDDDEEEKKVKKKGAPASKKARKDDDTFEEDDESESEDEGDRAEARIKNRLALGGELKKSSASSAGIIEEISMENFMCHKRLSIKFCRRINFISGANGSGKSAILAALQICLGASARSTHRGSKMGDLVREGHHGQATVRVILLNEGDDAAKPELYGNRITIERKFSRQGKAELRLLSAQGAVVSKDRKALREILDCLKICVENPVCVLDQENSKHFIRGKAKEKYEFFLKATEIQQVLTKIRSVSEAADQCASDAERQRGRLEGYARAYNQAKEEYDEIERMHKIDQEIIDLKAATGWVAVASANKAKQNAQTALNNAQKFARDAQAVYEKEQYEFDIKYKSTLSSKAKSGREKVLADATNEKEIIDANQPVSRVTQLEEELTRLKNELDACHASTKKTAAEIAAARSDANKLKRARDSAEREVRALNTEVANNLKNVQSCKEANASRQQNQSQAGSKAAALEEQVANLQAKFAELEETLKIAENQAQQASTEKDIVLSESKKLGHTASRLAAQLKEEESRLNHLEAQKQSPLAAFGQFQPRLHAAVQRHLREFEAPPIGPIGACLKLANAQDTKWIPALSASLTGLGRWIVTNQKDRSLLNSIARQANCDIQIIVQKARPRYQIHDLCAHHQGRIDTTVTSILNIENDLVFNALVDNNNIDTIAFFSTKHDAETRGMTRRGESFELLQGVNRIFLANGDETGSRRGSLFYKRAISSNKNSPLGFALGDTQNTEQLVAETKNAIRQTKQQASEANREFELKKSQANEIKNSESAARRKFKQASDAHDRALIQLNSMRADLAKAHTDSQTELADVVLEDVDAAETELRNSEESLHQAEASVAEATKALENHNNDVIAPLIAVQNQHHARNKELVQEEENVHCELTDLLALQKDDEQKVMKEKKKAEKARARLSEFETALEEEDKRLEIITNKAIDNTQTFLGKDYTEFPHPLSKKFKSAEAIQVKINALSKQKDKALSKKGIEERDPQVAKEKVHRARAAYKEKEKGCKQIEQESKELKADASERWERLKEIRRHICRFSDTTFDEILQKKGSSGTLKFSHKEQTLGLVFQKDNLDASTQIENITSLSGGERSFTTLAMLLSIGSTIECPFRVMDEFDVFMDQVARKVAMKELVEMAQHYESRQFIFITPQDLSSLPQSQILKVLKLHPPIRGQQTLNFAPHQSQPAASQSF